MKRALLVWSILCLSGIALSDFSPAQEPAVWKAGAAAVKNHP